MATDRTTASARFEDAGEPSRAEIQQRITSLYNRAETDSGTFNATRAMKNGSRRTVTSVANSGRRAADPSVEAVAKQWFDVVRTRIGPTTPATLPADRLPERPAQPQRPAGSDAVRELEAGGRRAPEAGGRLELEAGERRAPELTARAVPELTAGAVAALPAVPAQRQEEPKALLPAPASAPAALPGAAPAAPQSSLRTNKDQIRRKLTTAREVLARAVSQPAPSLPAIESRPVEQTWDTGEVPAYRTTTDTWSGLRTDGRGTDMSGPMSGAGLAPTAGTGPSALVSVVMSPEPVVPAPVSIPTTPEPVRSAPVSGFPAPETGILAASYGDLLAPTPEPAIPQATLPTPEFTLPTPQATLPTHEFTLPIPQATLPTSEFTLPTPQLPFPAAEVAAPAPAPAPTPAPTPAPAPAPAEATGYTTGPAYLGKADKALAFARAQIGRPCVWGATGPGAYDCSSLTQAAWKAAGVTLPRAAIDQAQAFTRVGLDDLQPGDLVFFHDDLSHTGLCSGNGMMIHAPGPGAYIREESVHSLGEGALRGAVRPA
ncbi:C40 family peptidase [Streptomyces aurantiogriseus]|uniref:NlpC/P60 domain-containing protein n=1 Tax=Streptomyces aurantiogriseus TaxID=66870 RepID=A0A918F5T6_9ACTN|nr:C40 family peptidase [Streptomyces aurantiogriseus]GGR10812.1 hypothetical protein GCM10010251_28520 [Streptomyces aurantiogriseus]